MRKVLTALTALLVVSVAAARADVISNSAPADEYFGPYQQSVLEIRNRLNDYDRLNGHTMLDPSVAGYLDHLQLAIRDWEHKYPRDPWLPPILGHLMREYWRAGEASSPTGLAALAFMRAVYPDAPITARTVALIYGSNPSLDEIAKDGSEAPSYAVPVAYDVQPATLALPPAAAMPSYADIPSYATPLDQAPTSDVAASDVEPAPEDSSAVDSAPPADDAPTPPPTR